MATNNLAYNNFIKNMASVDELLLVYNHVIKQSNDFLEQAKEMLRACIVISVSALDNYMHDFYRNEIIESYLGQGNFNVQFSNLRVSIECMKQIGLDDITKDYKRKVINDELRKIQKTESYQSPKSIEYIFSNLGVKNVWNRLKEQGIDRLNPDDIKRELSNIIDRRNKISHESDWDFIREQKYPIDESDVKSTKLFITTLVKNINKLN